MEEINKKRLIFDIVPASTPEDLDLKAESLPVNTEALLPDLSAQAGESQKEVSSPAQADGQAFDDLLSNIIKDKIPGHQELAAMMEQASDPIVELASLGARFNGDFRPVLANFRNSSPKSEEDDFHNKILNKIREPIAAGVIKRAQAKEEIKPYQVSSIKYYGLKEKAGTKEPEIKPGIKYETKLASAEIASFYNKTSPTKPVLAGISDLATKPSLNFKPKPLDFHQPTKKKFKHKWIYVLVALGLLAYGLTLKNELVREGFSAIDNLQQAQESLKNYNFSAAAKNFSDSYNDFASAGQNLNLMGAGLAGIFGDLPGLSKLKSAKDIVEAGKLLAGAGQAMSEAVSSLSQTGAILNPADKNKIKPSRIVAQIKSALELSDKNLQKAKLLLASIDDSIIPEDKKDNFHDFKDKIPLFEQYLGDALEYADFLEGIVGIDEPKKYLLLFENNSELRPTGGFPGTYGVVSFASGGLSDFFVNDVYNLDGQLKRNIIPPKQLQHITPNWGMRDSAWFNDFPTSARKAMWFFEQEAGFGVDGVITVNPDIVSAILAIVGPIELPKYEMTLNSENFVESIQEEVEYGPNRAQPKQVVSDFAPLFLEKLYSADSEKWMKIFNILMAGLDEKDIMFYFNEKYLQDFSIDKGFGGEIKNTDADYMMVTFTNVKGSKTDAVTDSAISINTRFEGNRAIHKVIMTRNHKGGDEEHGFYNRQNPAYVRVLLPEGAELIDISGNDTPGFRPLTDYNSQFGFETDSELKKYESGFYYDKSLGVDKFEESDKKGIGFWMITDPGKTKKIEFEYSVPLARQADADLPAQAGYNFYFQKQPGLDWKNFKFSVQESEDFSFAGSSPVLNRVGDLYILDTELKEDLNINIKLK